MQEYQVEVTEKKYLAPHVVELAVGLVKPKTISFQAGQFVFFNIGGAYKAYSMTSPPAQKHRLRFLIKLEPAGRGSNFISSLKAGQRFELTGPEGYFTVKERRRDICCVAAGIGIAPFASIVPHLLGRNYPGRVTLLYGCGTEAEIYYRLEFQKLQEKNRNFEFIPVLSRAGGGWRGESGRVTLFLRQCYPEFQKRAFYVCGKLEAVTDIENLLKDLGHKPEDVRTETFLR